MAENSESFSEVRKIAERVLARAAANRAYAEQQYGPQAGEPDEVALARYALEAEKTLREIAETPDGPGWCTAAAQRRITAIARVFLAEQEPGDG